MYSLATDLAVILDRNEPTALASALAAVAAAGINVEGYAEFDGVLHLSTGARDAARRALDGAGFPITAECPVLLIGVEDRPGAAAELFRRLADEQVSVEFTYFAAHDRVVIAAQTDLERLGALLVWP